MSKGGRSSSALPLQRAILFLPTATNFMKVILTALHMAPAPMAESRWGLHSARLVNTPPRTLLLSTNDLTMKTTRTTSDHTDMAIDSSRFFDTSGESDLFFPLNRDVTLPSARGVCIQASFQMEATMLETSCNFVQMLVRWAACVLKGSLRVLSLHFWVGMQWLSTYIYAFEYESFFLKGNCKSSMKLN